MEFTSNYSLKKPDKEDFYNIEDFNDNADIIDVELKKLNDKADAHIDDEINTEEGVHGIRWFNDKLEFFDGSDWIEIKTDYYYGIAILPHDEEDKFNNGTNIYIPTVSLSNEYYAAWKAEIANILGVDDETTRPFRIVIETIKQRSSSMIQNVYTYSHFTSIIGSHLFTFHRVYGFDDNKWRDWQIKRPISLYSEGSPEGMIYGIYGVLCLDILNSKLYLKKGSKTFTATNTNWELIGGA